MRTNFHYLLISSSLSPRITLGRAYTLVLLDFLLFFLPNSVMSMFSQLKNSASGKIKLLKLYFCLECFYPHFSSYHAFLSSRGNVLLFRFRDLYLVSQKWHLTSSHLWQLGSQTLWEFWQLQVLIGTKKIGAIITLFLIILAIILFLLQSQCLVNAAISIFSIKVFTHVHHDPHDHDHPNQDLQNPNPLMTITIQRRLVLDNELLCCVKVRLQGHGH